jgi:hypothetical protein
MRQMMPGVMLFKDPDKRQSFLETLPSWFPFVLQSIQFTNSTNYMIWYNLKMHVITASKAYLGRLYWPSVFLSALEHIF